MHTLLFATSKRGVSENEPIFFDPVLEITTIKNTSTFNFLSFRSLLYCFTFIHIMI